MNVSGMMANHKLAKAIADMGFYEFRRQLEYKSKLYGSKLVVADRFYPS
ncbi:Transposase, IS605 OrfB, partial [Crocosphaera watsonii WH 0401]